MASATSSGGKPLRFDPENAGHRDDASATFRIDVLTEGTGSRVVITGELDFVNTQRFASRLESLRPPVVLDLSGVTFLDSSGIDALVAAHRRFGSELAVRGVPPRCWRLFELTGLDDLLGIEAHGRGPPRSNG